MRFQCFSILPSRSRYPDGRIQSRHSDADLIEILKASDIPAILRISESIDHLEFKERLVQLLIKGRPDFAEILKQLLFETPIKAHRYILNELNHRNETEVLRSLFRPPSVVIRIIPRSSSGRPDPFSPVSGTIRGWR